MVVVLVGGGVSGGTTAMAADRRADVGAQGCQRPLEVGVGGRPAVLREPAEVDGDEPATAAAAAHTGRQQAPAGERQRETPQLRPDLGRVPPGAGLAALPGVVVVVVVVDAHTFQKGIDSTVEDGGVVDDVVRPATGGGHTHIYYM